MNEQENNLILPLSPNINKSSDISCSKEFDIVYPNFQHRHSAIISRSLIDDCGIKEDFEEEKEEELGEGQSIKQKRRNSYYDNCYKLKRKLNILESDNIINYKPFLSTHNISHQMDKITEVKEDTPVLESSSPRIKLVTDYLEDLALNLKTRHSTSSTITKNIDKINIISEEYGENGEENGKETKKVSFFPKFEKVIDKYEQNFIDKNEIAEKKNMNEIIQSIVIEEECLSEEDENEWPQIIIKPIDTPKSDEFDEQNENHNLKIMTIISESETIKEDDEKKIDDVDMITL